MFSPIVNSSVAPSPATALSALVNTSLPNSIALRAPSDNVAPSISSAELYNNASGNKALPTKTDNFISVPVVNSNEHKNFILTQLQNNHLVLGVQASFLAQLAGGDITPEVRTIFAQYDKLVSYANVKYKPSNAGKPTEPSGMFGKMLQQEESNAGSLLSVENILEDDYADDVQSTAEDIETSLYKNSFEEPLAVEIKFWQLNAYKLTAARNDNVVISLYENILEVA